MTTKTKIHLVYFLYGPEDFLIEEQIQRLMEQTLSQKERDLNLHVFNGEGNSGEEVVQAAQTVPMFSQRRFVLVREADHMDKEKMEPVLKYIQNPSPSTCVVLQARTVGHWKDHRNEIERVGKIIEYPRLRGRGLVSWIRKRMAEKGKTISEEAADYLIEVVGDHLHSLENSLEEAFLSSGEKRTINLSDVEEFASDVKVSTIFDLTDAIGRQDLEKALAILEKAMDSKGVAFKKEEETPKKMEDPTPLLLSMMAKHYWNILRAKSIRSSEAVPWNVKKLIEQGKNFSESSLREGIGRCHETDLSIKRGRGPKNLLMEKLVIDLCRPTRIHTD